MIGTVINERYEIIATIGEGGMASVYRAKDLRLQREVAIKILHPHIAKHEEFRQRFYQEAAIAAKLVHPNIVQIHDYGTSDDGRTFIISELIRGRDFHQLQIEKMRTDGGPFSALFAAMVCEEVLKALSTAHKQQVVHRDVKPDNVMIATDGTVKLTDFGIAKNLGASLTVAGNFLGSPVYSSPEQVQGEEIDSRSDIFSTGIILYEAVTGVLPFNGQNAQEVMLRIAQGSYQRARAQRASVPPQLDNIIDTALRTNRKERFATADAMGDQLRQFLIDAGIESNRTILEFYFAHPQEFHSRFASPRIHAPTIQQPSEKISDKKFAPTHSQQNREDRIITKRERTEGFKTGSNSKIRQTKPSQPIKSSNSKQWFYPAFALSAFVAALSLFIFMFPWNVIVSLNRIPPTPTVNAPELPALTSTRTPSDMFPVRVTPPARNVPETPRSVPLPAFTPSETRKTTVATIRIPKRVSTPEPLRVAVVTTPRQPISLSTPSPRISPTRSPSGKVMIQSIPSGVAFSIDGKNLGTTAEAGEGKFIELKPGAHVLVISSSEISGVRYAGLEQKFFVESGKTYSLGTFRLLPYRQLTLAIGGPGVVARINGDPYAINGRPLTVSLPEGNVEIRAKAANGKTFERTINLKGDNFTLNVSLE